MMKHLRYLILTLAVGCSTNEEAPVVKTYSDETNRAFLQIERGDSYYLKKPLAKTTPIPQIKRKLPRPQETIVRPATPEEIVIDEKINYQESKPEKSITTLIPPTPPANKAPTKAKKSPHQNERIDERLIEINQNLAFYCMKHRKDPRFGDSEEKCMSFVTKSLEDCQKIHKTPNKKLLGCIQTKLKRR